LVVKKINLLVTCVGGRTVPALLHLIKKSDFYEYRIIGVDAEDVDFSELNIDVGYRVPTGGASNYADTLLEICNREEINFILPGSDEEALALSINFVQFKAQGIHPIVSDIDSLTLIMDKHATYTRLERNGVRVPEYSVVYNNSELRAALDQYGYPTRTMISKPAKGRGGRGLVVYQGEDSPPQWLGGGKREIRITANEVEEQLTKSPVTVATLLMPMLTAPAYDADVVAKSGDVQVVVVRERKNPSGIPFKGNVIHMGDEMVEYCSSIASALNLNALHDIDLMTDFDGEPCVIEVNPRPSGSMVAALVAGIPVIDITIQSVLGDELTKINYHQSLIDVVQGDGEMFVSRE
jgi:carbamoyl-phosphate synthase large subunit